MDDFDKSKLQLKTPAKHGPAQPNEACEDVRRKKPPLPIQVNDRQATEVEILFSCLYSPENKRFEPQNGGLEDDFPFQLGDF